MITTFDGYKKRSGSNTSVLLDGGGTKALSGFIGSLTFSNNKITYTKADSSTSYTLDLYDDFVTLNTVQTIAGEKIFNVLNVGLFSVTGLASFTNTINGSINGNSATTNKLLNARTITIGSTGKSFDGSANVSWTLAEIGALSTSGNAASATYTYNLKNTTVSDLSVFTSNNYLIYGFSGGSNTVTDKPTGVDAFGVISFRTASGWYGQLLMSSNQSSGIYWRTATSLSGNWKKLLDSDNTKIENGVITINGVSITPLTSHLSLSNYVTLNGTLTITGVKTFNADIKLTNGKWFYTTIPDSSGGAFYGFYNGGNIIGAFGNGTTETIPTYVRSTGNNLYHRCLVNGTLTDYLIADSNNVSTGDSNGLVKIAGTNVNVKGLSDLAYKSSVNLDEVADGSTRKLSDYTKNNQAIPYIVGPSTDTIAGTWTGTTDAFDAYVDGLTIIYVPAIAGASTTTLNINGLGAKTCYVTNSTKLTAHFDVGVPIMFTYKGNTWRRANYWINTNTWRNIYTDGTSRVGTGNSTKAINFVSGTGITVSYEAAGTSDGLSGDANYFNIKLTNSGVRSAVIDGNYLKVNTNGTEDSLTIPYASNSGLLDGHNSSYFATSSSLSNYLPLSGGKMTGSLTWKDSTALPEQTSPQYFLVADAFASGGTTKWASLANIKTALGLGSNAYTSTSYLPLSGGTMTGSITFPNASSAYNSEGVNWTLGSKIGEDLYGGFGIYANNNLYLRPGTGTDYTKGIVISRTDATFNGNSLLHAGNKTTTINNSSTDAQIPTALAVYTALNNLLATNDALVYAGTVNGSATSPGTLFPTTALAAGSKGKVWKVAQSGYINGVAVEIGDMIICNSDSAVAVPTSSNYSTVNANFDYIQTNLDPNQFVSLVGIQNISGEKTFDVLNAGNLSVTGLASFTNTINGSINGNAATTDKLKNARNLKVSLSTTSATSFDGSANAESIGVTGTLAIGNGGTGTTSLANINKNFVGALSEANADVIDGTHFITSYASDNGFAESNAVNVPYKRTAVHVFNYIKSKLATSGNQLTLDNVIDGTSRKLSNYLLKTGGTISSEDYAPLNINNEDDSVDESYIRYKVNSTNKAFTGYIQGKASLGLTSSYRILIGSDGALTFASSGTDSSPKTIAHSGNSTLSAVSLTWGTNSNALKIAGTLFNVTLPSNPNTDTYVSAASFAMDNDNGIKMTLSRSGTITTSVTGTISQIASTTGRGLTPKLALNSTNTIATQSSEYVLTYKSGTDTTPVWRKLPANAFLNDNTTNPTWTSNASDAAYPIGFCTTASPTSGSRYNDYYNTIFTFNPSTKALKIDGCTQQYDSTNKCLKFIFTT